MRFHKWALHAGIVLLALVQYGDATLMLTSLLMAAQTGMMMGKLSVGGLLMMLLAAQQNQTPYGGARSIRAGTGTMGGPASPSQSRRYKRAIEVEISGPEEKIIRDRMVRQIDSTFDSLTCIPKFVCGMNAAPPSKKTSLLNDYGHLIKTYFVEDEKDQDDDDELDSEEEAEGFPKTDEEFRLALKEKDKLKEMANEELLEEDPGMIGYVLKDVMQDMTKLKNPNRQSPGATTFEIPSGVGDSESEEGPSEAEDPSKIASFSPLKKIVSAFRLPSIKIKSSGSVDDAFDKDPFFAGFKRSMRRLQERPDSEDSPSEPPMTREARKAYVIKKKQELEKVTDPVQKYQIAEEIGQKTKSKQDCAAAFRKCPYEWEQVMAMVNTLRQNVLPKMPEVNKGSGSGSGSYSNADKVVFLKTSDGKVGSGVPLSLNPDDGVTTVTHDLGNGNTVEISMKLYKVHNTNKNNGSLISDYDDELEDDPKPMATPIIGTPVVAPADPNATVLNVAEIADDEWQDETELNSAAQIFQAINSGKMRPKKNKNAVPFIVSEQDDSVSTSQSSEKVRPIPVTSSNKTKKKGSSNSNSSGTKVEVDDEDKSVTVILPKDKNKNSSSNKGKEKVKEEKPEDSSEEYDDDFGEGLVEGLVGFRDIYRPSGGGQIGAKFTKDKKPTPPPSPQTVTPTPEPKHRPDFPPPLMRRRSPGITKVNAPPSRYRY